MLDDTRWSRVEHAINNFPVMMGGVMMIAAARAAAGEGKTDAQPQDPGKMVRALVADRLGKSQLDAPTCARIRAHLAPADADSLSSVCDDFAGGLPALTTALRDDDMLAYIARGGPGDAAFDQFMQRFMVVAQRIQEIVQTPGA